MRYFKIKIGYGDNEFIPITEDELETAYYCFLTDGKAVFDNGPVRGKDIITITEDFNRAMGWNPSFRPTDDDWNDVRRRLGKTYQGALYEAKRRVIELIEKGRQDLIGKPGTIEERLALPPAKN